MNFLKLFACDTRFSLKQKDFPMLPCNVSVRNSVCNLDKTVNYVCKSIYKFVSNFSVLTGKLICDSSVPSSKLVSASSICPSKTHLW